MLNRLVKAEGKEEERLQLSSLETNSLLFSRHSLTNEPIISETLKFLCFIFTLCEAEIR